VAVEPKLVTTTVPVVAGPEMKKKDLIEKIVKRSGVKKKDVKPVVEAMLAVLGEALTEGRELVLQPMGRLKVTRVKDTGNGRVLICRLRQGGGDGKGDKEALADDDD
jgi:DNA-binding protein HU-alpha